MKNHSNLRPGLLKATFYSMVACAISLFAGFLILAFYAPATLTQYAGFATIIFPPLVASFTMVFNKYTSARTEEKKVGVAEVGTPGD